MCQLSVIKYETELPHVAASLALVSAMAIKKRTKKLIVVAITASISNEGCIMGTLGRQGWCNYGYEIAPVWNMWVVNLTESRKV